MKRKTGKQIKSYALGGEAGDLMDQLEMLAEEQGITIEELLAQMQGGGEELEEGLDMEMEGGEEEMEEEPVEEEQEGSSWNEFARGGIAMRPRINVEGGEVIQTPDGRVSKVRGPKHENGGVDLDVPAGTKIYSDRVKIDGKSMEERKLARERANKRLAKIAAKNPSDKLLQASIARTAETTSVEEAKDMAVQKILNGQDEEFGLGGVAGPGPRSFRKYNFNRQLPLFLDDSENPLIPKVDNDPVGALNNHLLNLQGGPKPSVDVPYALPDKLMKTEAIPEIGGALDVAKKGGVGAGLTAGDYIGLAGNLFNAIAPIINTRNAAANTKPNINRFKGFGKEAIDANDKGQDIAAGMLANANTNIDTNTNTALGRNRNSARSVNTLRALDAVTTMGADKARATVDNSFASQMINLLGQRGQLEMRQDQAEMQGETNRDIADKMDLDNYYSNMANNLVNAGSNIQGIGQNLNTAHSNQIDANLISQLSKYGLTFDKKGNLISK